MNLKDIKITQQNVNKFLNEIHVKALADSIQQSINKE